MDIKSGPQKKVKSAIPLRHQFSSFVYINLYTGKFNLIKEMVLLRFIQQRIWKEDIQGSPSLHKNAIKRKKIFLPSQVLKIKS